MLKHTYSLFIGTTVCALITLVSIPRVQAQSPLLPPQLTDGVPSAGFDTILGLPLAPGIIVVGQVDGSQLTQVNVTEGESEPTRDFHFTELNLSGGTLGNNIRYYNSEINVSGGNLGANGTIGGTVPSAANAGAGALTVGPSTLNFSDGNIGNNFNIFGTANISGGVVGQNFVVQDGGVANISGGSFGSTFAAADGSTVNISGSDTVIGFIPDFLSGSTVNISGGTFGSNAQFFGVATIDGGTFASNVNAEAGSEVTINGGTFEGSSAFDVLDGAEVTVGGGNFTNGFDVDLGGVANISGGNFEFVDEGHFFGSLGDTNFFGTEFFIDGTRVTPVNEGEGPGGQVNILGFSEGQVLTGILLDGSEIEFGLNSAFGSGDFFSGGLTVTASASTVPEPSSLALLGLAGLGLITRRNRG